MGFVSGRPWRCFFPRRAVRRRRVPWRSWEILGVLHGSRKKPRWNTQKRVNSTNKHRRKKKRFLSGLIMVTCPLSRCHTESHFSDFDLPIYHPKAQGSLGLLGLNTFASDHSSQLQTEPSPAEVTPPPSAHVVPTGSWRCMSFNKPRQRAQRSRHPIIPSSHHPIIPSSHHPIIQSSNHPIITFIETHYHTITPSHHLIISSSHHLMTTIISFSSSSSSSSSSIKIYLKSHPPLF